MRSFRRLVTAAVSGAVLALPIGFVALLCIGLAVRLSVGPGPPFRRIWLTFGRSSAFLMAAGAIAGLMYLRATVPPGALARGRLLLSFSYVALALALGLGISFRSAQYGYFWFSVLRPQFNASATEAQVRAHLGPPTSVLRTPAELLKLMFPPCDAARTVSALTYADTHGNSYRVLYFDAAGHYVCDDTGRIW